MAKGSKKEIPQERFCLCIQFSPFGMTQAELARRLGVTRSGVNAWEMGITTPSTQYIVELALQFRVSTDYLLDMPYTSTISVDGLSDRETASIMELVECLKASKK